MTHTTTTLLPLRTRTVILVALAVCPLACSVALQPAAEPARRVDAMTTARPTPAMPTLAATPIPPLAATATAMPDELRPSPIAHLEHLPYDAAADAPAGDASAHDSSPGTDAPQAAAAAPAPIVHPVGTITFTHRGDLLVAPAAIAGRPVGDVLLDTGAGDTFVDHGLADELQLPPAVATTAADDDEARLRELRGFAVGGVPLATDRAFVVDLSAADGGPLAGVLGLPALGTSPFTLDFATGVLTLHSESGFEPPAGAVEGAFRIDQGRPFVEATLADGTAVWLLLDSGSPAAIAVWHGFATQHPKALRPASAPDAVTPPALHAVELRSVQVLGARYGRVPVLIQDAPGRAWQRARVVGRVGMALLRTLRITVHPETERIWVERAAPAAPTP